MELENAVHREVKKGQIILYQGEAPRGAYLLKSGFVRSYNISPNGDEKTIALYGTGDFFPVAWIFEKSPVALYYYEALEDSEIAISNRDDLVDYITQPDHCRMALDAMARNYVSALMQINSLGQTKAQDKILRIMQYLSLRFGEHTSGGFTKVRMKLTQEDIARLVGLTRETTAIELSNLKKQQILLVKNKHYTINNKQLIKRIGEDDAETLSL